MLRANWRIKVGIIWRRLEDANPGLALMAKLYA